METDQGHRPDNSEEYSEAVQPLEVVEGWCANCVCYVGHSLGDDDEACLNCGCRDYDPTPDDDLVGRFSLPKRHAPMEIAKEVPAVSHAIFIGTVSRSCKTCGEVKLYKAFNNSKNPETACNYCTWEDAELAMLLAMTNKQRDEIAEIEEEILENEMAYEEAQERQEMIDMVLRGLDE